MDPSTQWCSIRWTCSRRASPPSRCSAAATPARAVSSPPRPGVAREHIAELLETGDAQALDEAQNLVREMIDLGADPAHDAILAEHGVDLLDHAGRLADRPEWHPSFAEHQVRRPVERVRERRAGRMRESERRRRRRPTAGDDMAG